MHLILIGVRNWNWDDVSQLETVPGMLKGMETLSQRQGRRVKGRVTWMQPGSWRLKWRSSHLPNIAEFASICPLSSHFNSAPPAKYPCSLNLRKRGAGDPSAPVSLTTLTGPSPATPPSSTQL